MVLVLQEVEQAPAPKPFSQQNAGFDAIGLPHCQQRLISIYFSNALSQQYLRLRCSRKCAKGRGHRVELGQLFQHPRTQRKRGELR